MKYIQITTLSLSPEDEVFKKALEWWESTIALAFGIPASKRTTPSMDAINAALTELERLKEAHQDDN